MTDILKQLVGHYLSTSFLVFINFENSVHCGSDPYRCVATMQWLSFPTGSRSRDTGPHIL